MGEVLQEPGFDMVEAAKLASLDRTYMYLLAKQGKLRTFEGPTGKMKVSRVDLEIFLRDREAPK